MPTTDEIDADKGLKSGDIPVQMFRQVLLFPLRLERTDHRPALKDHLNCLDRARWSGVKNIDTVSQSRIWPPRDVPQAVAGKPVSERRIESATSFKKRHDYAEAAYFHPFVQRFLYSEGRRKELSHLVTLKRKGLEALIVEADYGWLMPTRSGKAFDRFSIRLEVERANCHYVPDPGIIVFSMEVAAGADASVLRFETGKDGAAGIPGTPSLAEIQSVMDCLRRSFPPYFTAVDEGTGENAWNRALFPRAVTLLGGAYGTGLRLSLSQVEIDRMIDRMLQPEQLHPLAPWWSEIFCGFNMDQSEGCGPLLQQIGDERMTTLSFVAVEKVGDIRRSDLVRLCFADNPGDGYPYQKEFLADFEARHCYDRFWHWGTRYMLSPYSTTLLAGTGTRTPERQKENFALDVLQEHLRRHYFRLALMVQINKAGLLAFSSWLSASMRLHGTLRSTRYRREVSDLRRAFLEFSQISWFSNVSNQEQARDLYERMMEQAGNPQLYEEVARELEQARAELAEIDAAKQAEAAAGLNVIALVASAVGLFLGYAQLDSGLFGEAEKWSPRLHVYLGAVMMASAFAAMVISFVSYEGGWGGRQRPKLSFAGVRQQLGRAGYLLSILTLLGGAILSYCFW